MKIDYNPYDLCPCESGKKAKFCCMTNDGWNKKSTVLKRLDISHIKHPKCYANFTENCSNQISKEHYISKNLLSQLEHNKTVKIVGLPMKNRHQFSLYSLNSLVAKVLCANHNSLLSPFDSEIGRFSKTIIKYDAELNLEETKNDIKLFSGIDLERWMLKTACAFIASNLFKNDVNKANIKLKEIYIDILFNNYPFPKSWGMYGKIPDTGIIQTYHSISIMPLIGENELKAVEFLINNHPFYLLLGVPDNPNIWGIYRPRGMEFQYKNCKKTIEICWGDPQYNTGIFLNKIGTTNQHPENWDEYLKQ